MNAKKMLALLLALVMVFSLAACGGDAEKEPAQNDDANVSNEVDGSEEKVTVKLSYPVLLVVPTEEGTANVEKAINEYLDSIGENFHVDLDPIDGNTYPTDMDMALLGNTPVDVFLPLAGLSPAVNEKKVMSLNDYLDDELKGAVDLMGEDFLKANTFDGQVYGIPAYKGMVLITYWVVRQDVFDQTGLDPNGTYDMAAISDAMAKIQAVCPEIPAIAPRLGVTTGNSLLLEDVMSGVEHYACTDLSSGGAVFGQSTQVENYYESEMFEEMVRTAYAWNQAGYVTADASIETEEGHALLDAGRALSYFIGYANSRATVEGNGEDSEYPTYAIPVATDVFTSNFLNWCIAHSCQHPSEAAKMLNLLYTDETFLNLVIYGIEGEDYVTVDESGVVDLIDWPEGLAMESVPYTAYLSCGIMGNQFIMHTLTESGLDDVTFMKANMDNAYYSPLFGFTFNNANVANQVSAVSNVVTQYYAGLLCGELDPDVYLPKFQAELKDAGIDDILTEMQTQVDAWLVENE